MQRLRAWNDEFARFAPTEDGCGPSWVEHGLTLAHELQRELPDVDIRYYHSDDDRPLRAR